MMGCDFGMATMISISIVLLIRSSAAAYCTYFVKSYRVVSLRVETYSEMSASAFIYSN